MKPFLIIITILFSGVLHAQDSAAIAQFDSFLHKKTFVFKAETCYPARSNSVQLGVGYDLRVKNDTISTQLPFYGVVYNMPYAPAQGGGIIVHSRIDKYIIKRKKNGWELIIEPKDRSDTRQFTFNINKDGFARMVVISAAREIISFNGPIVRYYDAVESDQ